MTNNIPLPDAAKRLSISWERAWLALLNGHWVDAYILKRSYWYVSEHLYIVAHTQKGKPTGAGGDK